MPSLKLNSNDNNRLDKNKRDSKRRIREEESNKRKYRRLCRYNQFNNNSQELT